MTPQPRFLVCLDWAKEAAGRAAFAADARRRCVFRLAAPGGAWTLSRALDVAETLAAEGPAMVLIDAALGLPAAFLRAAGHADFLSWLVAAQADRDALRPVDRDDDWSVRRPFFRVPGTVGSGTLALWNELLPLMPGARLFALAPFEGQPPDLVASGRIVLAELYPRACYSAALRDAPAPRHKQRVDKSVRSCARAAVDVLASSKWVKRLGVELRDLDAARGSEHELDALLSAAGLLRALLDGEPLYDERSVDARAEGLLFGSGGLRDVEPWAPCPCRRRTAA